MGFSSTELLTRTRTPGRTRARVHSQVLRDAMMTTMTHAHTDCTHAPSHNLDDNDMHDDALTRRRDSATIQRMVGAT